MAFTQKSSFQKKQAPKINSIKGTSPSLHNSQLLISSGIPSFDSLIGGGIPVGSLVLINEDEYATYAKLIIKYFLAEGIMSQHAIFLGSEDVNPEEMIYELPASVDADVTDKSENEITDKKMTIAWRYENLKTSSHLSHKHFGHYYDLSKNMDEATINNCDLTFFTKKTVKSCNNFEDSIYYSLLTSIKKKIESGKHFVKQPNSERNILRIALFHLNSSLWHYDNTNESNEYLLKFLYSLRAMIRNAFVTCCFTLPFSKVKKDLMDKCIHLSDFAVQLQSFSGTPFEYEVPYKDYNGFFVIQKLATINSMVAFNPQMSNLAFKLKRKKLVIEAFNLPPELDDTTERDQNDSSSLSCSSFKSNRLEF